MGTIADKLQNILVAKADIGAAITEKGGTVPRKLAEYGAAIRALPSGEAGPPKTPGAGAVYRATRPEAWPELPVGPDTPDGTILILFQCPPRGTCDSKFAVDCDGNYTVERLFYNKNTQEFVSDSVSAIPSGSLYSDSIPYAEFPTSSGVEGALDPPFRCMLLKISAASLTAFWTGAADTSATTMREAVEIYVKASTMEEFYTDGAGELRWVRFAEKCSVITAESVFEGCASLLSVSNFDAGGSDGMPNAFRGCGSLLAVGEEDGVPNIFAVSSGICMFRDCCAIRSIEIDAAEATSIAGAFSRCVSLEWVTIKNHGRFNSNGLGGAFANCISLRHLELDPTVTNWAGADISIDNCAFDRAGLVDLFESLPTVTAPHSITLTGNPGVAGLTEEDKTIATEKNWTLVLS